MATPEWHGRIREPLRPSFAPRARNSHNPFALPPAGIRAKSSIRVAFSFKMAKE